MRAVVAFENGFGVKACWLRLFRTGNIITFTVRACFDAILDDIGLSIGCAAVDDSSSQAFPAFCVADFRGLDGDAFAITADLFISAGFDGLFFSIPAFQNIAESTVAFGFFVITLRAKFADIDGRIAPALAVADHGFRSIFALDDFCVVCIAVIFRIRAGFLYFCTIRSGVVAAARACFYSRFSSILTFEDRTGACRIAFLAFIIACLTQFADIRLRIASAFTFADFNFVSVLAFDDFRVVCIAVIFSIGTGFLLFCTICSCLVAAICTGFDKLRNAAFTFEDRAGTCRITLGALIITLGALFAGIDIRVTAALTFADFRFLSAIAFDDFCIVCAAMIGRIRTCLRCCFALRQYAVTSIGTVCCLVPESV